MPNKIIEASNNGHIEGNAVIWVYPISDFIDEVKIERMKIIAEK